MTRKPDANKNIGYHYNGNVFKSLFSPSRTLNKIVKHSFATDDKHNCKYVCISIISNVMIKGNMQTENFEFVQKFGKHFLNQTKIKM